MVCSFLVKRLGGKETLDEVIQKGRRGWKDGEETDMGNHTTRKGE